MSVFKKFSTEEETKNAKNVYLGVELECEYPRAANTYERRMTEVCAFGTFSRALMPDFMLQTEDGGGIEVQCSPVTLRWMHQEKEMFKETLKWFKDRSYLGETSVNAGMHVHIDRTAYTVKSFIKMVEFFVTEKEFIKDISGRCANHSWGYQSKLVAPEDLMKLGNQAKPRFLNEAEKAGIEGLLGNSVGRSTSFNAFVVGRKGYPTIEYRMFGSTLDETKFFANVEFIHALAKYCNLLEPEDIVSFNDFFDLVTMNSDELYPNLFKWLVEYNTKKETEPIPVFGREAALTLV